MKKIKFPPRFRENVTTLCAMIRGINGFKDGFSITCNPLKTPGNGYVVSLSERTQTYSQEPTVEQLTGFLVKNWDLLRFKYGVLGGWSNNGTYYLDVNMWYFRRHAAIDRGRKERQLAIWDVAGGGAIHL